METIDYVADYLAQIRLYLMDSYFPRAYGKGFWHDDQTSFVITVPAIWSDKAKHLTFEAALRARFTRSQVTLVTEPEAAALYSIAMRDEADISENDCFLVCDAGGGTVVCPCVSEISNELRT